MTKIARMTRAGLLLNLLLSSEALAQVVINEDQDQGYTSYPNQDEQRFLRQWNQRHGERGTWQNNFGPRDAVRLLERRGYRVLDVKDVGPRFLLQASREGEDVLVSVSRQGEIMGIVHERE